MQENIVQSGFIHTFSLETKVSKTDLLKLKDNYEKDGGYFHNGKKNIEVLSAYANEGIRIEFEQCEWKSIHYDPQKREKKVLLVINPYKMLHHGEKYGAVLEKKELLSVQKKLVEVVQEIHNRTGVDLFDPEYVKIKRVDCTYDVVTPSEEYSQEIIRIAKHTELPKGYKHWKPCDVEQTNLNWRPENAMFMYNHNQEVESKIYNKKQDDLVKEYLPDDYVDKGLLRYELTLKRNFLKKQGYITKEFNVYTEIFLLLNKIIENSESLLYTYLVGKLDSGAMLSKRILKKYVSMKCSAKKAKKQKMLAYIDYMNGTAYGGDNKVTQKVKTYFAELGISPIYASEQCPYIPSFSDLLLGKVDNELLGFAKWYNKKKRYPVERYWE